MRERHGGERQKCAVITYLGDQSLKETTEAFMLSHVAQDSEPTFRVVEVSVLDSGLDDIERGRDDERGRGTSNGGNEVLEPGGLVVVLEVEEELLGKSGTTEKLSPGY